MATYTKTTDFLAKDSLPLNNAAKYVKGSEIDTEYNNIATADADNMKKSAMGTGVETFLGTPSSANLAAAVTNETGSGLLVFNSGPILTSPSLTGGSFKYTLTGGSLAADRILNVPVTTATDTLSTLGLAQTWTAAQTFRAASAVRSEAASTQDAMVLAGRAGGSSSYAVTLMPTTLTDSRTVTFPDAATSIPVASYTYTISGPTAARTYTFPDANASVAILGANTFTAQQSFTGPTAAAPAIAGASDPNTGVFFPDADTVAVATAGIERMRIDTSGKITASTTTGPNAHVFTSTAASAESSLRFNNTQSTSGAAIQVSNSGINAQFSLRINSAGWLDAYVGQAADSSATTGTAALRVQEDLVGTVSPTTVLGYGTGAGGTVTQATSRVTGVTLSKPTGAITLFTAAGSATATTFTVTNTVVASTDTVVLSVKSGTNVYLTAVTAVANGSFNITFWTTGGTASDAPVINFAILKGATS